MKVRACVVAAAIAAGLCWSPSARAEETPPAVSIVDATRFFTAPRALGDAWERAVQAVRDGMRAMLDAERAATQQALATAPPPKRAPAWHAPLPPPREVRQASRPVAVTPVSVEPPTQSVVDVRGQRATLLGARVELPWTVP